MAEKLCFSVWSMQLKQYLQEIGDARLHDVEFINGHVDSAAAAYEDARRQGMNTSQAMEVAHAALMEGLGEN